jgi:Xaa-Pro aminopeptidase
MSPVEKFKSLKNAEEIEGLRNACRRDSLALCQVLASLEERFVHPSEGASPFTEIDAANLMGDFRRKQPFCIGDSFHTISSVGANSAVIHYRPEPESCKNLEKEQIYLIDTGGQYKDGTTDATRTVHFGEPSAEQKRCYTRVLQGHMNLAMAVFPTGTPGIMLDAYARQPLWQDGLQYGHGTGHGIGAYLNVHEGPAGIGGGTVPGNKILGNERMKRMYLAPFEAGQFVSDEPGCYIDGKFGIRIEADLVAVKAETKYCLGGRAFLSFEYLTLVPMCRTLLDMSLLSPREEQWLDAYHSRVWDALKDADCLSKAQREWLWRSTRPLRDASVM